MLHVFERMLLILILYLRHLLLYLHTTLPKKHSEVDHASCIKNTACQVTILPSLHTKDLAIAQDSPFLDIPGFLLHQDIHQYAVKSTKLKVSYLQVVTMTKISENE